VTSFMDDPKLLRARKSIIFLQLSAQFFSSPEQSLSESEGRWTQSSNGCDMSQCERVKHARTHSHAHTQTHASSHTHTHTHPNTCVHSDSDV